MEAGITGRLLEAIVQYGALGAMLVLFARFHFNTTVKQIDKQQETLDSLVKLVSENSISSKEKDERMFKMLDQIGSAVNELSKIVQIQNKVTDSLMKRYEKEIDGRER